MIDKRAVSVSAAPPVCCLSKVWLYFSGIDADAARCHKCDRRLAREVDSTGNLSEHLAKVHTVHIQTGRWRVFDRTRTSQFAHVLCRVAVLRCQCTCSFASITFQSNIIDLISISSNWGGILQGCFYIFTCYMGCFVILRLKCWLV